MGSDFQRRTTAGNQEWPNGEFHMGTFMSDNEIERRRPAHAVHHRSRSASGTIRFALMAVELIFVISAVGGGLGLLTGSLELPDEWLDSTPFDGYAIPAVILAVVVGGSWLAATWAVWARHPLAPLVSVAAGVVQLGWFAVQIALLGYISWMQPFYAALALITIALAWWWRGTPPDVDA
jgi:hypothetical protein